MRSSYTFDTNLTQIQKSCSQYEKKAAPSVSWGARGRGFESRRPDHKSSNKSKYLSNQRIAASLYLGLPKPLGFYRGLPALLTQIWHKLLRQFAEESGGVLAHFSAKTFSILTRHSLNRQSRVARAGGVL